MDRLTDIDQTDIKVSAFLLFVETAKIMLKYIDSYLYKQLHLSVSRLIVLQTLSKTSGGLMPSEIARWTNTERHNITTLISRMKQEGLVTAERNGNNKRLVNIKLTDEGRELYERTIPVTKDIFDQVMLSITEADAVLLKEKLTIIRQNISRGLQGFANPEARAH